VNARKAANPATIEQPNRIEPKRIRLMADYFCFPLWRDDSERTGEFGDIDPRTLAITADLATDLMAWSDWFDRGLDMNDPASSCWVDGEKDAFVREGQRLLERLRGELGPSFVVTGRF
jgi:hypothetical protein